MHIIKHALVCPITRQLNRQSTYHGSTFQWLDGSGREAVDPTRPTRTAQHLSVKTAVRENTRVEVYAPRHRDSSPDPNNVGRHYDRGASQSQIYVHPVVVY